MSSGIHHITLITRKVQANVDFYAGFLGLRLVKQTAGFEDAEQLHLFYGDAAGTPGSLVTFLVWEDGAPGRAGYGQIGEFALAIQPESIGFWLTRALAAGLRPEGPRNELGEPVLRLKDPDGIIIKLVGVAGLRHAAPWAADGIPPEHAVGNLRSATLFTEEQDLTRAFFTTHFGYRPGMSDGAIERLVSDTGDALDLRNVQGFWSSAPGAGTVDHIALRATSEQALEATEASLRRSNATPTTIHDRKYFTSLYAREPGGVLVEMATDAPGMGVDEPQETLGSTLFIPQAPAGDEDAFRVVLPQFAMPGEPRVIYRELPFVHRFHTPDAPDGGHIVLLHGSGGTETSLMPLAARTAPHATLLGVRGRATEEGAARWFRRLPQMRFDQADIRSEAEAFEAFCEGAAAAYGVKASNTVHMGYSNGANFLAAFMRLHPGWVRKAVLIRPMDVLEESPEADLTGVEVLMVVGAEDRLTRQPQALCDTLSAAGATVTVETVAAGHFLTEADDPVVQSWLETHTP